MVVLVMGGAASGKSEYAEQLCQRLAEDEKKIYIATMQPYGEEAKFRIQRHHELRAQKGFFTIEKYTNLSELEIEKNSTVLLECMSTLLANEYFSEDTSESSAVEREEISISAILRGVENLKNNSRNLVIVTNQIFSDGIEYGKESMEYLHTLGILNQKLGQDAEAVIQVVCGIPVVLKNKKDSEIVF